MEPTGRAVALFFFFLGALTLNIIYGANGDVAAMAKLYPTANEPATWGFGAWWGIYAVHLAYLITVCVKTFGDDRDDVYRRVLTNDWVFGLQIFLHVLNGLWIFAFVYDWAGQVFSTIFLGLMWATLIAIHLMLEWRVRWGFSIYFGWVHFAFPLNILATAGVVEDPYYIFLTIVVTIMALYFAVTESYLVVLAGLWALLAIWLEGSANDAPGWFGLGLIIWTLLLAAFFVWGNKTSHFWGRDRLIGRVSTFIGHRR